VIALDDGEEVVAGKLADDAGEHRPAVREQELGLADAAGVPEDLAGRRMTGRVLRVAADADVEVAERDPGGLAAPADMDDLAVERQQRLEGCDRLRRALLLELRSELELACGDLCVTST